MMKKTTKDMTQNKGKGFGKKAETGKKGVEGEAAPVAEGWQAKLDEALSRQQETEKRCQELQDNYTRLMADLDNLRRHSAEERLKLVGNASADTIKGLLPVLDDFERAIKMVSQSSDAAALEGLQLIYDKLMAFLKTKGLEVIEAKGQPFDTDRHEAVAQFPVAEEEQKGKVFDVAQTGYTLRGEVLRYAKVVVGI